ncbi:MAG: DUF4198 domain-containing protein [Desulfovibrionaceae bacterium]
MWRTLICAAALTLGMHSTALAHFGMVIPSSATVTEKKDAALSLDIAFLHPMEMVGMDMEKPRVFSVVSENGTQDLRGTLRENPMLGKKAWKAAYTVKKPGVYQFIVEPQPYWEPAEDCYIIHYTKTYVAAFGEEEGWDKPAGLKTEIVPLTRPFGNYAGNVFQGQVLVDGKPVPGADVEIEYYNRDRKYQAENDYMVTQIVKADANGVFTYAVPFAGWWGFAALTTAREPMLRDGKPKPVEQGAVLWTRFTAPRKAK